MSKETCPLEESKKCAIVSNTLIDSLANNKLNPVSVSDMNKMIEMSDTVMFNERRTLSGQKKIMAVKLSNSDSWLKLDLSKVSSLDINKVIEPLGCK